MKQSTTSSTVRCSLLPPQLYFIRKATACLHSFIPICADSIAVGMVIVMFKKVNRLIYGDRSYYIAHILISIIIMTCTCLLLHFRFNQPIDIVLHLISNDTIGLSASLLGFQLAGVSILISLDGNKKLCLLREIKSDTMIYKIFISSITMFLFSIVLMLISINFVPVESNITREVLCVKLIVDYCSVVTFCFGMVFLLSSIRLLKWFCSK